MRRAIVLAWLAAASCSGFDPRYPVGVACGEGGECPPDQICAADHRCQLASGPDAAGACLTDGAQPFVLRPTLVAASLAAASSAHTPSCTPNVHGREAVWYVDLDEPMPGTDTDLVADVEDTVGDTGVDDAVIEISNGCADDPARTCTNATDGGAGEVAVLTHAGGGRHFVIVDSGPDAKPDRYDYKLRIFARPVLGDHAPCDFALLENRCADGTACVDTGGETRCAAALAIGEGDSNESCAGTTTKVSGDAIVTGTISRADRDLIELAPAAAENFRVHLYGADGGCPGDLKLSLADAACAKDGLGGDDNSLGGCTYSQVADPLDPAVKHYLEVAAFDSVSAPVPYTLVIDFDWH